MGRSGPPSRSSPSSTAMPTTPIPMPTNRIGVSRSSSPTNRAARAATKGTGGTRRRGSELDSGRSAYESSSHGPAISRTANSRRARQCRRAGRNWPRAIVHGSSSVAPTKHRPNTTTTGDTSPTATLISRYGIPQITDIARKSTHPRLLTPVPSSPGPPSSRAHLAEARRQQVHPSGSSAIRLGNRRGGREPPQRPPDPRGDEGPGEQPAQLTEVAEGQVEPLGPHEGDALAPRQDLEDAGSADDAASVLDLDQAWWIPLGDDHRVEQSHVPAAGQGQSGTGGQPATHALRGAADRPHVRGEHPLALGSPVGQYLPHPLGRGVDVHVLDHLRHRGPARRGCRRPAVPVPVPAPAPVPPAARPGPGARRSRHPVRPGRGRTG